MRTHERRLIVERSFDRTVEAVIEAFLGEDFTIRPLGAGDLRHPPACGDPLRYAVLEGWPPEAEFPRGCSPAENPPWLSCKITVYELVGSCTLVTATPPGVDYSMFAALAPTLEDRLDKALNALSHRGVLIVAA
jgi:hypothetical protein